MFSEDIKLVHSNSLYNKNPDQDLGGLPSVFEISVYPMNNLFDNIYPKEALSGLTDYRCFYIYNRSAVNYIRNASVILSQIGGGSTNQIGSVFQNDIQHLTITATYSANEPDTNGYIIVDPRLGPPITVYWNGSISSMAADFQSKLRMIPMCDSCAVSGSTLSTGVWQLVVTFTGDAGNRYVPLINILANRLNSTNGGFFRVSQQGVTLPAVLCPGDTTIIDPMLPAPWVAFNKNISVIPIYPVADPTSFPAEGIAWAFNKCLNNNTGGFQQISYIVLFQYGNYMNLGLNAPIGYYIEMQNEVYIDPLCNNKFIIAVSHYQPGSPINATAEVIANKLQSPCNVTFGPSLLIEWLKPLEGFFIWVERLTPTGTVAMANDGFDLTVTGDVYLDWCCSLCCSSSSSGS